MNSAQSYLLLTVRMATMVPVEMMMMFVSRCPGVVKVSIAWLLSDTFCLGPARPYSACWV